MSTITVDPNTSYQTWKGWEATAQAGQDNNSAAGAYEYPSATYANYKTALLAAMADLGLDRFRLEVGMSDVNATGFDVDLNNDAIQPSTATSGQWHYDRIRHAMDDLVVPYTAILAAQGETPYITICLVDFKGTGYAAEAAPSEYAFLVDRFVADFYTTYGFLPHAIESILEADNQTAATWTQNNLADDIVAANALLVSHGYTGIKWITPSTTVGANADVWWTAMKSHNAGVIGLVNEIAYHRYVAIDNTNLATLASHAEADGASPAMLEWITATHLELYDDLTTGHGSSWQQYTIAFPYPGAFDDGGSYFQVNTSTWAVTLGTRTKYLRHYMKYIRRGAVMKGVSNSSASYKGVPFQNSNGTFVVPIKCTASGTIDVIGLPAGTYGIRYTTGDGTNAPSAYDQALTNQTISTGGTVTFTMPAAGVATVYDVNYISVPALNPSGGRGARRLLFH